MMAARTLPLLMLLTVVLLGVAMYNVVADKVLHGYSGDDMHSLFDKWAMQHGRVYQGHDERERRFSIFMNNSLYIHSRNQEATYSLGLNQFSDMTNEEFEASLISKIDPRRMNLTLSLAASKHAAHLPRAFDWRDRGAITPVKNQGHCGSCWVFAAIAAVEAQHKIATGEELSLSEQQVIDCNEENRGCGGGWVEDALLYISGNQGVNLERNYPYTGKRGTCDTTRAANHATTTGRYFSIPIKDELAIRTHVVNQPVFVQLESSGRDFQHYRGGVFTGACGTKINHSMLLIGYGTNGSASGDFWILKNSWGTKWGEHGYMRMQRYPSNTNGLCGMYAWPAGFASLL